MQPTRVDSRRGPVTVHLTARVRDSGIGVTRVTLGGAGNDAVLHPIGAHGRRLHLPLPYGAHGPGLSGTSTWTGSFTVGRWVGFTDRPPNARPPVGYQRAGLVLEMVHGAGNDAVLREHGLTRRGLPSAVRVRTLVDASEPRLSVTRPPGPVDITAGSGTAVVLVHAVDRQSGVGVISVGYDDPDPGDPLGRLISGSRHDGIWRVTYSMSRCYTAAGLHRRIPVRAVDRAGNVLGIWFPRFEVVSGDFLRPYPHPEATPVGAAGQVIFRWDEHMTGLTEASAPIHLVEDDSSTYGPPLPGTWVCRDEAGAAADCDVGVWRTATWTPGSPLAPGVYNVLFNPEHVLSLTDLAGNPSDGGGFAVVD